MAKSQSRDNNMRTINDIISETWNNPLETMLTAFRDECEANNFDVDDCTDSLVEFFRMFASEFGDNGYEIAKNASSELYSIYKRR